MRYGFWLPVFGGWLRNIDDEQMPATWDYVRDLTIRPKTLGYDLTLIAELNLNDIKGPEADSLDAWSTAAALAAVTKKLELMVAVRPTFHNPALLAKQAANIDRISNGRLTLNVVSSWWADEAKKYGIPFDEHDDRYARTSEWLDVLDQLLVPATHHPQRPLLHHRRQHPLPQAPSHPHLLRIHLTVFLAPSHTPAYPCLPHPLRRRRIRNRQKPHRRQVRRLPHARRRPHHHRHQNRRHETAPRPTPPPPRNDLRRNRLLHRPRLRSPKPTGK